jgi:phenol 2-monooxygenase
MLGDSSDSTWGVIDLHPRTNFPDIRRKTVIQATSGNLMIIPREGDSLVRFYIELPGKKAAEITEAYLLERASQIFQPFTMESAKTVWWSAYVIGQRVASQFTQDHRVFLAGDACHTHSPKAGQGMNVSLQDGYNIGWKLCHVLTGRAPESLLETYVSEREKTAKELIAFDQRFSKLFSTTYRKENNIGPEALQEEFTRAGRYTAGLATAYNNSILTHNDTQGAELAKKLKVGMRLPSAIAVRLCDGKRIHLSKAVPADGRWHLIVLAPADGLQKLQQVCVPTSISFFMQMLTRVLVFGKAGRYCKGLHAQRRAD